MRRMAPPHSASSLRSSLCTITSNEADYSGPASSGTGNELDNLIGGDGSESVPQGLAGDDLLSEGYGRDTPEGASATTATTC